MKRIARTLAGLSLAVIFFAVSALADDGQKISANVPFEFTVGNTMLPAGQYEFLRTADNILVVRDADGRSLFAMATPVQTQGRPDKSLLKFATVHGRHVLVQVWDERDEVGSEIWSKN